MNSTAHEDITTLEEIERIHDDEPARAAQALRTLDTGGLDDDALGSATFLFVHVLGEKFALWDEAAERIEASLAQRTTPPLRALRNAAVAHRLAGHAELASHAQARLAEAGHSTPTAAALVVDLHALAFAPSGAAVVAYANALLSLAERAGSLASAGGLEASLAAGLSNATSSLLERAAQPPSPTEATALRAGAQATRAAWQRAGNWVQHERAEYLMALVFNRCGDSVGALEAAQRGLSLIAANGEEEVDRAFLLLQAASAQAQRGAQPEALVALRAAQTIARSWSDEGLRTWFADELSKAPALETLQGSTA